MGKLSATGIKAALKKPGRHSDGDGLILQIGAGGAASWLLRVQKDGRRRDFGLGSYKKVSLSRARELAEQMRRDVEARIDPIAKRQKAAGIPNFREAADQYMAERKGQWRNAKHREQWVSTLKAYAYPAIGDASVSEITGPAVRELLIDIWLTKPETARRVLQRIASVVNWACAKGFRVTEFPSKSVLKGLPKVDRRAKHFAAMPHNDVPAFFAKLQERESWGRLALRALILTAARSGEVRLATWDEIDLENGLWSIPADRMKAKREHVVPLSPAAVAIFRRAADLKTSGHEFVFHGTKRDKPMSDMTLTKILRDMELPFTVHGFRSSFRDWVSEDTSFSGDLAEAALAHAVKDKTEAAYRRGTLLEKRHQLMAAWARHVDRPLSPDLRIVG